jgi:secreted trypsin-like serine protease
MGAALVRSARALAAVAAAGLMATGLQAAPVPAVIHGSPVEHPESSVPWVVVLYETLQGEPVEADDLVCTGTAIDARTVLTAAHCIEDLEDEVLTIGYGAPLLSGQVHVPVVAVRENPRYDPYEVVHDVALLRTAEPMSIASFPALASKAQAKRARTSGARLVLYGWGYVDRTRVLSGQLAKVSLRSRTHAAKQVWGPGFNVSRQIAAGARKGNARAYPGACEGDSGGPLVMSVRGRPVVVGVTSYGEKRCGAHSPTIFTSVGRYRSWIRANAADLATVVP